MEDEGAGMDGLFGRGLVAEGLKKLPNDISDQNNPENDPEIPEVDDYGEEADGFGDELGEGAAEKRISSSDD